MDEYNEFAERDAARAQADADEESLSSQYVQALGLLSTLKGDMLINVNDPIGMAKEIEAYVSALRQRAEAAEQWQTQVPWSALRSVLDAAFQFAQGNGELWADCEKVEAWAEVHEIGDESCATIHPETWQSVTAKLGQTIVRPEFPVDPVDYE